MNEHFAAVLWDFGGVITSSPFEAFNRYEAANNLPVDFIRRVNAMNSDTNAWSQFESARISAAQFDALFAAETAAAGHRIQGSVVIELLAGEIRPRMVEVLKACKRHYRVACITNNVSAGEGPGMSRDAAAAAKVHATMQLFDFVLESSKEGIRKPDPRLYLRACKRLCVTPDRVVFLDDLGVNLKPARELGMATIKVTDEDQAIADLSGLLKLQLG
jgi:putative hydrolase of the HAD superfamily